MKKLLIFAILIAGCSEEHEPKKRICNPFMTISDAIPVQFWVNGVETYNQKAVCGINSVCYCQPFQCDDEIRIQFTDSSYVAYNLLILDSSGSTLDTLSFSEISNNVWELSFIPSELSICDENIRLIIQAYELFANSSFDSGLDSWTEVELTTNGDWSAGDYLGDNAARWISTQISYGSNGSKTINIDYLRHDFTQITTASRTVTYSFRVGDFTNLGLSITDIEFRVRYRKNGSATAEDVILSGLTENTSYSGTFATSETDFDQIEFYFRTTVNVTNFAISNVEPSFYMLEFDVESDVTLTLANSDCLDIQTSHDCTALIRYDNAKDFAGIEYSDFSPTAEFYLRIPAVFFHERNTEEEENFELSSENMVRLRNEIKLKRLLELGFMPDYMHRKLLLILAHDTVEIDGEEWIKRDPYEKEEPGNKRYPLKKASVLLTQKDYIKRNIL